MEPLRQRTGLEANLGHWQAKVVEKRHQRVGVALNLGFLHNLAFRVDDAHTG